MYQRYQEIPIWQEGRMPFPCTEAKTEHFLEEPKDGIERLTDVSIPTITYYPVSGKGPHPAVLVCPGGGYGILAWNHEGIDICSYFNSIGFSAFLLKYRVPDCRDAAHADAARAMRFIRKYAEDFNVIPDKIGVLGFSAGAHLAATITAPANEIPYEADADDDMDALPYLANFSALIYPAYLCDAETLQLHEEFNVTAQTPPTFILQAENDEIQVENALAWFLAMKKAGAGAELHCYERGGHGYGILRTGRPISNWARLADSWFRRQAGVL